MGTFSNFYNRRIDVSQMVTSSVNETTIPYFDGHISSIPQGAGVNTLFNGYFTFPLPYEWFIFAQLYEKVFVHGFDVTMKIRTYTENTSKPNPYLLTFPRIFQSQAGTSAGLSIAFPAATDFFQVMKHQQGARYVRMVASNSNPESNSMLRISVKNKNWLGYTNYRDVIGEYAFETAARPPFESTTLYPSPLPQRLPSLYFRVSTDPYDLVTDYAFTVTLEFNIRYYCTFFNRRLQTRFTFLPELIDFDYPAALAIQQENENENEEKPLVLQYPKMPDFSHLPKIPQYTLTKDSFQQLSEPQEIHQPIDIFEYIANDVNEIKNKLFDFDENEPPDEEDDKKDKRPKLKRSHAFI